MRTVLALCFIALFAGAFATKSKEAIPESKLVSALKGLFQIADEDEFDQVADILAQVQEEVEGILAKVQQNYADQEADYSDTAAQYQENIDTLTNELQQVDTDLTNGEARAAQLQEAIDNSLAAIESAQADQDNENARRVEYHNAFRAKIDQLNAAVDAAEDALRLLQEIDTQDLSGSFLEINNKKIKNNFEAINNAVANLKLKSGVSPITKMLLEVAASGINHDLIGQIEDLLGQLVEMLNNEVDEAVQDDNNDDAYSRNTLQTLQDTIDLETGAAAENHDELSDLEGDLALLNQAGANFASTLAAAQSELAAYSAQWSQTADNYDALIARLRRDIAAIEAAEKFVDRD